MTVKTIKDEVIELGGKWPSTDCKFMHEFLSKSVYGCNNYGDAAICTKEQFESTAKRIGYINGYRYGVEYPTNGVKPDLPDELKIEVNFKEGNTRRGSVYLWNYPLTKSFKINDPRYAPTEEVSEISESKSDHAGVSECPESNWYDRGELPPVGTACEWKGLNGGFWVQCEVIDKYQDKEMVVFNTGKYRNCRYEILKLDSVEFRPIKTERQKVIEAAAKEFHKNCMVDYSGQPFIDGLGSLFDAGMLVLPLKSGDTDSSKVE